MRVKKSHIWHLFHCLHLLMALRALFHLHRRHTVTCSLTPPNGIVLQRNMLFLVWCAVHVTWPHQVYELCDMECGDVVFIAPCVCGMWDITGSSFGCQGGYPKLSFSPLFHHESILILLQISHGFYLSLPLQLSSSSTLSRMFPVSWPCTRQLCRVESLHPPEHHVTSSVSTDTTKDARVARVSDRTCLNKQKQKICVMFFEY